MAGGLLGGVELGAPVAAQAAVGRHERCAYSERG